MAERLLKAKEQLSQVEELLRDEPNNPELLELAKDLREAVSMAEALVGGDTVPESSGPTSSGWRTTSSQSKSSSASATTSSNSTPTVDFLPGQRCEVRPKKDEESKRWQSAVVLKRLPDYAYVVSRLFDSKELTVKGGAADDSEIREINPTIASLRHDALIPGLKVRARFSGDGKYYQATVEKRTEHGCLVRFEGYEDDEPEQVALEHVRFELSGEAPSLLAPVEIPKHLIVQADDSEDVKQRKLRQQKYLRRRAKEESIEQVHIQKQGNWFAFQATNKRVKGALTTVGGVSQFSTARNNPGARLGVMKPAAAGSSKD